MSKLLQTKAIAMVLLLTTFACKPTIREEFINSNGLLVKRTYFSGTINIKSERTFKNDTIPHGYWKIFFANGNVKKYFEYSEGKENGKAEVFSEDGKKTVDGWFLNGKADSTWIWYDSLGEVRSKRFYENGNSVGQGLRYRYQNGKRYLAYCEFYWPPYIGNDDRITYRVQYDSLGNFKIDGGYLPLDVMNPSNPTAGQICHIKIYQCSCQTNLKFIKLSIVNTSTGKVEDSFEIPLGQDIYYYNHRFNEPGEYDLNIETNEDTSTATFNVNKID